MNIEFSRSDQELSCRELAALAAPTCYVVVEVYTTLRNIFPQEYQKCQDAILDKYKSLKFFRCRWGIAGTLTTLVILSYRYEPPPPLSSADSPSPLLGFSRANSWLTPSTLFRCHR